MAADEETATVRYIASNVSTQLMLKQSSPRWRTIRTDIARTSRTLQLI
jgi:hypothetical protein